MDTGWVWTDNLRPLLVELGLLAGYQFDDSDWLAVEHGITATDCEAGPWFDYPVGHFHVSIALEPGADEHASVRVDMATEAELQQVRWLRALLQNWHLRESRC